MRRFLTTLIRLSELPPWIMVLASAIGVGLTYLTTQVDQSLDPSLRNGLSLVGLLVSLIPLVPVAVRDLNVWKLFPPRYHGINRALGRVTHRYATRGCFYFGEDNRIRVDALAFLRQNEALIRNLDFAGNDTRLQNESGDINAMAFSGTRYGLSAENKRDRNRSLARANPVTIALLRDGEGGHNGLAATLPLSEDVAQRYALGRLSDNDITGAMLAAPGEPVAAVVFFLIAHCRKPERRRESLLPETLALLIEASLLQLVLIALMTPDQRRFFVLAANSDPKMTELFNRLHLVPRPDYEIADQEDVYGNYVIMKKAVEAREHLASAHPALAAQLSIRPQ